MAPKFQKFQKNKKKPTEEADEKKAIFPRSPCMCEASIHELVNNCLSCGRIACDKEGSGPCFTCGTLIATKAEREFFLSCTDEAKKQLLNIIADGAKLDFMLENILSEPEKKQGNDFKNIVASVFDKEKEQRELQEAINHKDKLLDYDRNSVARSKVYDDQVDYFTLRTQNFISGDKRQEISQRIDNLVENKFKKEDKIVLNFETGTISDTQESLIKDLDAEHQKLMELSKTKTDYQKVSSGKFLQEGNSLLKEAPPAVYLPSEEADDPHRNGKTNNKHLKFLSMSDYNLRVQDKEQAILEDKGMCLAMRQPWATLLVAGIKKFEGRSWYSSFKGRLWIYAAAHKPTTEEIDKVERFYRQLGVTKFPRNYPTCEMVGCVTVEDCLPNSVYSEQYPHCEIDSPYAFVCTYPIQFSNPIPVQKGGGDKIYALQPAVHRQCKRSLGF